MNFLERIAGYKKRFYQFTAIDDCTRIRVLKIKNNCNQTTAINFRDEVKGVSDDIRLFNKKLKERGNFYNFPRPHGALDGETP